MYQESDLTIKNPTTESDLIYQSERLRITRMRMFEIQQVFTKHCTDLSSIY